MGTDWSPLSRAQLIYCTSKKTGKQLHFKLEHHKKVCVFGLTARGPNGELPAKKPTVFASSSPEMLARLAKKCGRLHRH